jgi:hypothetical protein
MQPETDPDVDPLEIDPVPEETPETEPSKDKPRGAALVINVYSWATPVVGVLMLVVGLLGGYFGRPLIKPEATQVAVSNNTQPAAAVATTNPSDEARRQELMSYLVGKLRHFQGDEGAPVTMVEFSDFQ